MFQGSTSNSAACMDAIRIINFLRELWSEHVMWTRSFIISTAANLGDLKPVTTRLFQNPADFETVLKQFYGPQLAKQFRDLLTEHLKIAGDLVSAAKAGNTEAVNEARKKWYLNADEIAAFLANINPFWSKDQWTSMLHEHLELTEEEAVARLAGQYARDIALYDAIEDQALMMGDYMAEGIIRQFSR